MKPFPFFYIFFTLLFNCLIINNLLAVESISIISPQSVLNNPISSKSISDCATLLKKACNCEVEINNNKAQILLVLSEIDSSKKSLAAKNKSISVLDYPEHDYSWVSRYASGQVELRLETTSFQGISFGLYGLLQEKLGFQFYHPKQSFIPEIRNWPLTDNFEWSATARFAKKGFHLHTMHPIELSEALLNVKYPNGIAEIKTYIDWLARNQQNYFEFNLLESIQRKKWIPYIIYTGTNCQL